MLVVIVVVVVAPESARIIVGWLAALPTVVAVVFAIVDLSQEFEMLAKSKEMGSSRRLSFTHTHTER